MDDNLLRGNRVKSGSGSTDLTELLLKTGHDDQKSLGGWWRMRSLVGFWLDLRAWALLPFPNWELPGGGGVSPIRPGAP